MSLDVTGMVQDVYVQYIQGRRTILETRATHLVWKLSPVTHYWRACHWFICGSFSSHRFFWWLLRTLYDHPKVHLWSWELISTTILIRPNDGTPVCFPPHADGLFSAWTYACPLKGRYMYSTNKVRRTSLNKRLCPSWCSLNSLEPIRNQQDLIVLCAFWPPSPTDCMSMYT